MIKSYINFFILFFCSNIIILNCSDNPVNQIINPHIAFEKTFGGPLSDHGYSVIQSTDGSFLITGLYIDTSDLRQENIFLIKTDINGNMIWEQTYGGSLKNDYGYSVIEASNGGYMIAGATRTYGAGDADFYLIKTDINGNLIWDSTYGGSTSESGKSIIETTDGGFVITGLKYASGTRDWNIYVIKTDNNGNLVWEKTFGGYLSEIGYSIIKTTDETYVITGLTNSIGAGSTDVYLLQIDISGNLIWERTFGGSLIDIGYSVIQSSDEGFMITGKTNSSGAGDDDIYLIKTDDGGNLVWEKTYGGSLKDRGLSLIETTQGSYVIAGETRSFGSGSEDIYFIKIDIE